MSVSKSAWSSWPKEKLRREIGARMRYFYGQTDGTLRFPSSAEGDLLKMVASMLSKDEMLGWNAGHESGCPCGVCESEEPKFKIDIVQPLLPVGVGCQACTHRDRESVKVEMRNQVFHVCRECAEDLAYVLENASRTHTPKSK